MKFTRYGKYVPDPAGEMSMEDLLNALSDYLLESGFHSDSMYFQQMDEHSLDALRQAIQQALENGSFLDEEMRERLEQMQMEGTMEELVERLYGSEYEGLDRTIDFHVANLRKKLEATTERGPTVQTVFGIGYKLRSGNDAS